MAILEGDIKILASERLTDNEDGGGKMTGNVIVDGLENNLFDDISELDRTYGNVSLRKIYPAVLTDNVDVYYGANAIVALPPSDPNVSVCLFSTKDWFDERTDARNKIESYVVKGPESTMQLYGDQLEGQRTLLLLQREEVSLPEVGEVYVLSVEDPGLPASEQYVRITEVAHEVQTFTDTVGDFKRRVLTLTIGNPLRETFPGGDPTRYSVHNSETKFRTTSVADASKYYSAHKLSEAVSTGALSLKVDSVYTSLVPSTQAETGVVDAQAGGDRGSYIQAAPDGYSLAQTFPGVGSGLLTLYAPGAVRPFALNVALGGNTGATIKDDGVGGLTAENAWGSFAMSSGTIDYDTGRLDINFTGGVITSATWNFPFHVKQVDLANTHSIPITLSNRGYVYVATLSPIPSPGTLTLDYMALGKWYRLKDNGKGVMAAADGASGIGTGTVNYATGSVNVTLGALPDTETAIMYAWGVNAHYARRDGELTIPNPEIRHTAAQGGLKPTTVSISWLSGAVLKTVTDDGAGQLTGDGTGRVIYSTGELAFTPTSLPDVSSQITIDYEYGASHSENFNPTKDGSGFVTLNLANPPIKPGSVRIQWQTTRYSVYPTAAAETHVIGDDGLGGLTGAEGSINYATGALTFKPQRSYDYQRYYPDYNAGSWIAFGAGFG